MITFQNANNIIVTKRSNHSSQTKNSEKKEKTSTNFFKLKNTNKNKTNDFFNKTTLSLTSLKLKSKSKKKTQNIKGSQITKKAANILSIKTTKNNNFNSSKKNIENHKNKNNNINEHEIFNKNSKSNHNVNYMNNDYLYLSSTHKNSDNLSTNYMSINDNKNNFNLYPKPEPMPVKICKNNYFYKMNSTSCRNNIFSPANIMSNIDIDMESNENDSVFDNFEKIKSEKKYYSTLQKFFEINNSKDNKKHKRNNTNLISNNNFKNFIENINNENSTGNINEFFKNNRCKSTYDTKLIYVLKILDLDNLINIFSNNCINFNDLFLLTKQDLIEMNIPIGQRNRLIHFLDKYKSSAKNYDFKEVQNFLDIYKNNNIFKEKNSTINNITSIPNFKKNNYDNINNKNINNKNISNKDYLNNNNESKKIKNTNYTIELYKNNIVHNTNIVKYNLQSSQKDIQNDKQPDNTPNNNNLNINISNFERNNSNIDMNKNYQTFSSISNSKAASIEDLNYKDYNHDSSKILFKRNTQKSSSTINSNIDQNDTTVTTINNKIRSNHFLQNCNNLLDEVDNFNSIYTKLKQKTQNRNKQITLLLNKKTNIEYLRDKINNEEYNKIEYKEKKNIINMNDLYYVNNNEYDYLNEDDFNELKSLKEESIRDLNKELKMK